MGVSLAQNILAHRQQFHMSRLREASAPSDINYQETLNRLIDYFMSLGGSATTAQRQATEWIGRQLQAQAALLAYIDVFHTLMLLAALIIPLALILRRVRLGARSPAAH